MVTWVFRALLTVALVTLAGLALANRSPDPTASHASSVANGSTASNVAVAADGSAASNEASSDVVVTSATPDTTVGVQPGVAAAVPTPRPTATAEKVVERIISRLARETQVPYPTSTPLPAGVAFVSVIDFGYMPSVTRIRVGQTVVWQNGGRELHDVTGEDDWHSGPIEGAAEYRHTFGFEGSFDYRCSVHPDMRGTIIVTP